MREESREVPCDKERQKHKHNCNRHEREPAPGLLIATEENATENRQKQNHLELRQERKCKEHRSVLEKSAEVDAVKGGNAKDAGEQIDLSPNRTVEQKRRVQGHKRKHKMCRVLWQLEACHQAARQINKSNMAKVNRPQAEELDESSLFYRDVCQAMDLRHNPEPKNIKRRIVAVKAFKPVVRQLLDPIHPIVLVTAKSGRIRAEQVCKQADNAPNQKILERLIVFHPKLQNV